jgi:uncharacterized membrane protein YesL
MLNHEQRQPAVGTVPATPRSTSDSRTAGGKVFAIADALAFVGVLNLLIIVMTCAGGVLFGLAPAAAAAAGSVRSHLRGDGGSTTVRFVGLWRRHFLDANALQWPGLVAALLLAINLMVLGPEKPLLGFALVAALGIVLTYQMILVAMNEHYELQPRQCRALAWRFMLASPGSPLLLAAALSVTAFITWLLPGLLPVFSLGAAAYICTALCLSFFAANDKRLAA